MTTTNQFAIVTGASSGIGYELAMCCANAGYDLLIVADEPEIEAAAQSLRSVGVSVDAVQADLATLEGVDALYDAARGRPVDALLANAGRGLGHAFLDQGFDDIRFIVDTNITGTLYLIHKVGNDMRSRGQGRMLITGSIGGLIPGTYQAVYNGTKAFLDSFSVALQHELQDSGVTVTCLMPGPTDTEFFERADMEDTKVGQQRKDDPAMVAKVGFEAMLKGESQVISGLKNKLQAAMTNVVSADRLAEQHRELAEPESSKEVGADEQ